MKRILYSICIGTLGLAMAAQAAPDENNNNAPRKGKARAQTGQSATATTTTPARGSVNRQAVRNTNRVTTQANTERVRTRARVSNESNATVNRSRNVNANRVNRNAVVNRERNANRNATNHNATVNRERDVNRVNRNATVNRERNVNRNVTVNRNVNRNANVTRNVTRNRNVVVTNNWRGSSFAGARYAAFRNYSRQWHNRGWWDSHYGNSLVFVFGAPYFWNAGYWYPAWGYNPGASYIYDGPIYGPANLGPQQVVVNVQSQLQRDGYYNGPIDGQLGPMTRQAIADFQADNGLAVTSAVDEPTLQSLGLA